LQVDFTAKLHEIDVPSCIIVGGADQLKGLEYANILHQGLPNSELHVLPGAGHAACWENPSQFNHIILGFLSKHKEHNM
jgi:2-succinyl-6-hydroxy-2,4-cyclohexadiene-1-carboxylate synthase